LSAGRESARADPRPRGSLKAAASRPHWLLIRGRGDRPLAADVEPTDLRAHSSSKRPSVQPGERAVLYAAVWQAVFAIVEIVGEPEHDPDRTRWAWRFPIRPLTVVRDLHEAPAVEEIGVFPQSLWRHSHIRISDEQLAAAEAAIAQTADRIARRGA
jgi:hypothetical protein